jgi:hypothetical protein
MIRFLLACLLAAAPVAGQALPPGRAFALTPNARLQLDTMAAQSLHTRAEASACITESAIRDTVYVVMAIAPAKHIQHADSISIVTDGPLCESWQPSIHSHIVDNGWLEFPSPIDYHTTVSRGVFGFLLSVHRDSTWSLRPYP